MKDTKPDVPKSELKVRMDGYKASGATFIKSIEQKDGNFTIFATDEYNTEKEFQQQDASFFTTEKYKTPTIAITPSPSQLKSTVKLPQDSPATDKPIDNIQVIQPVDSSSLNIEGSLNMSEKGLTLLKQVEKLYLKPYDDQTSKVITAWIKGGTIGYGHLIKQTEWNTYKNGFSEVNASTLLQQDLAPFITVVQNEVTANLRQNEFDALVILAFNIGSDGFAGSSVLKLVNNPNAVTKYKSLEDAWKAWNTSQGKVMKGLDRRRQSEWDIYSQGIYKGW